MKKILLILLTTCYAIASSAQTPGKWITLFDGKSADGLRGYKMDKFPDGIWVIKDGSLQTIPKTKNVDLVTKEQFGNFELEYEWAVDTAANSGIFFHLQEDKAMVSNNGNSPNWLDNFEIQILDDKYFNDTAAVRSAGSLYDLIRPMNKKLMPIGQFNKARLIQKDGHVEHWLNGAKVLDFEIGSQAVKELIIRSKYSKNPRFQAYKEGHIMLQHHGQRVYFKNVRVRRI
ncbi:DUF1080 domain-containing protein [Emticicia sp. BO119]|uniref:3-keto-disaccharide hydrolase n=1 Tax=Emticicia sp. BO119 TaxID=2757768 RepID=UPI0015F069FF|nr:DUF1080 domain-containing protein [Emticicia sp. BO119]MBA4852007.1 DUF1080 domain-containing protein [Emticicia sp. BO119]